MWKPKSIKSLSTKLDESIFYDDLVCLKGEICLKSEICLKVEIYLPTGPCLQEVDKQVGKFLAILAAHLKHQFQQAYHGWKSKEETLLYSTQI